MGTLVTGSSRPPRKLQIARQLGLQARQGGQAASRRSGPAAEGHNPPVRLQTLQRNNRASSAAQRRPAYCMLPAARSACPHRSLNTILDSGRPGSMRVSSVSSLPGSRITGRAMGWPSSDSACSMLHSVGGGGRRRQEDGPWVPAHRHQHCLIAGSHLAQVRCRAASGSNAVGQGGQP